MTLTFTSPEHRQRFLAIMRLKEKIYANGKLDPEYGAALYVLTSEEWIWEQAEPYCLAAGLDLAGLLHERGFLAGYGTLAKLAANLFYSSGSTAYLPKGRRPVTPIDLVELSEQEFEMALTAQRLRYYGAHVDECAESGSDA